MKRMSYIQAMVALLIGLCSESAFSQEGDVITVELIGIAVSPDASGTVQVIERRRGPDLMTLSARKLPPRSRITVVLTEDQAPGGLPAQFIGEFTTDSNGSGTLVVLTEVVNAFASGNPLADQTDATPNDGVVKGDVPAGDVPPPEGTAVRHPLNWIRGYLVPPRDATMGNVFGPNENRLGGPPVFISEPALPLLDLCRIICRPGARARTPRSLHWRGPRAAGEERVQCNLGCYCRSRFS